MSAENFLHTTVKRVTIFHIKFQFKYLFLKDLTLEKCQTQFLLDMTKHLLTFFVPRSFVNNICNLIFVEKSNNRLAIECGMLIGLASYAFHAILANIVRATRNKQVFSCRPFSWHFENDIH